MKKKLAVTFAMLLIATMVLPLAASVNAKPEFASVEFRMESWGDKDNPNEKARMGTVGNSTNILMHKINIVGNPPLLNFEPPPGSPTVADALAGRGGIELNITMGGNTCTLVGSIKQLLIHGMARPGKGMNVNEKATITITDNPGGGAPDGWDGSTLELSLLFLRGRGKIAGNRGTGIFKNVQFSGTFTQAATSMFVPPYGLLVYKVQWGTGEMMFA